MKRASKERMKVMVLGAGGMLGHKLAQVFSTHFDTTLTFRSKPSFLSKNKAFAECTVLTNVAADRLGSVEKALDNARPDVVVNCVGVIKQVTGSRPEAESIAINSLFPHQLAGLCAERGARLMHISTDCVFSGRKGMYREQDAPDAEDLYGRSKLLGEVAGPGCLTLRTSIIGREVGTKHGLVEWFLANRGKTVKIYTRAIYSGFPTITMAGIMAGIIENHPGLTGLWHVSSDPISKSDLLLMLKEKMQLDIGTTPADEPAIDRSMVSERFRTATGFRPVPWSVMLDEMIRDAADCGLY